MAGDKRKASAVDDAVELERPQTFKRASTRDQQSGPSSLQGLPHGTSQIHIRTDSIAQEARHLSTNGHPCTPNYVSIQSPTSPLNNNNGFASPHRINTTSFPTSQTFQHKLTDFWKRHSIIFGPAYADDLKNAHWQVTSSSDPPVILTAGRRFVQTLSEYVQGVQQAAVQQIHWRAGMTELGVSREALGCVDAVLAQLDSHIIGIGAEMENLLQELSLLEEQLRFPTMVSQ